jgi:Activator of Hsp90 ATPase homolog 1-like protein
VKIKRIKEMTEKNYQYKTTSFKSTSEVYHFLLNPNNWWVGLYGETIEGKSIALNNEFVFRAGDGVHYSKQKLIEAIPNCKIVWQVTDSELSFIEQKDEWTGTKICFELSDKDNKTEIIFTHIGLVPQIECYDACSGAWNQYFEKISISSI